jgi:4-amino-4-deoxy-L-arabinose transferase-like glycosyltransferase
VGWLAAVLVIGTFLRIWIWRDHGIDPDEGGHLMDARFLLRGLVPYVDYQPRGIVYTYLLAAFVRLVGPDYHLVRICVLLVDSVSATLIYVIARRLFDARAALLAACTYLLFPLTIGSSVIVHMEPFAVLSACGVAYLMLRHLEPGGGWGALLAAGILLAVGIYVRDSGLPIALSAMVTLALWTWRTPRLLLGRWAVLFGGFLLSTLAVGLPFYGRLSLRQWWGSPLNPLYVLVRHVYRPAVGAAEPSTAVPTQGPAAMVHLHPQPWSVTWHGFAKAVVLLSPMLIALALAAVLLARLRQEQRDTHRLWLAGALLYPWAGLLGLAYTYWTFYRGFFPEYFVELLPPLVMVFGFVLPELLDRWESGRLFGWAMAALAAWGLIIYVAFPPTAAQVPRFIYAALPPLLLARPWARSAGRKGWWPAAAIVGLAVLIAPLGLPVPAQRGLKLLVGLGLVAAGWVAAQSRRAPGQREPALFPYLGLVLLGAAAGVSLDVASHSPSVRLEGVWPPVVVREIADSLRRRGQRTDEVVSGAVIWEFQADRQPFQGITHPLKFEFGIGAAEAAALTERLHMKPPRFVVFDGYTELTYGAVLPALADLIRDRYQLVLTASGGVFPVRLYQLRGAQPHP